MFRQISLLTCYVFLLLGHGLLAKTIFVDDDASTGGDGTSWSTAYKHLQDALAVAEYGDEIWVAEGTYKPDQGAGKTAGDRASPFVLVNGVGMYGGFLGTETSRNPLGDNNQTILSGEISDDSELWSLHVVVGENLDANTTLNSFKITKGNANGASGTGYEHGGGMYLSNSSMTFSNLVFTNNSAGDDGGGIYTSRSYKSLTLTNCEFINNSAGDDGGAIFHASTSLTLTLTTCEFTNNSAGDDGGGIYSNSGTYPLTLTLTTCEFIDNSAGDDGGGIYSASTSTGYYPNSLILTNCVFTNNSADAGGGVLFGLPDDSTLTLTNCVYTNNSARIGGGTFFEFANSYYPKASTLTTCVFTKNSAETGGGIYSNSGTYPLTLTNCEFINNSAGDDGGAIFHASTSLTLTNSILWGNYSDGVPSHGLSHPDAFKSFVLQDAILAQYPGDPNARDVVYAPYLNILQGWDGDARAFDVDPLFVSIENPVGPDGIWFTEDDGLRLQTGSPAIDAGYNDALGNDAGDLDRDGNVDEQIPTDITGYQRIQGDRIDIGPYEYGDSKIEAHWLATLVSPANSGSVTGGNVSLEKDNERTISANPSTGYLFSNWSGDAIGSTNPLTITADSDKSITANFIEDSNDDDGDGLTNFAELATHGTDPSKQDSDNDGILDGKEIEIGSDPKSSDSAILNFGKSLVTSNPASYSLVTQSAYNQAIESAKKTAREEASKDFQDIFQNQDSNSSPYTPDWFYIPKRGWMWTDKKVFPWFHDANSSNWMYFKSGQDKPTFYHNGTKEWMTLE